MASHPWRLLQGLLE